MIPVSLCCGRLICPRDPAFKRAERAGDAVKIRYFRCLNDWVAQRSRLQISSQMRSAFYAKIKDFERHAIHRSDTLANRRVILDAAKAVALTQSEALR